MPAVFKHHLVYTSGNYTIDEVIRLLRAQKNILRLGISVLPALDDGIHIKEVKFTVEEISSGSIGFDIVIEVYNAYQTQIQDRVIPPLEKALGMDIPEGLEALITLLAVAAALVAVQWAFNRVRGSRREDTPPKHVEGNYNQIIQIVSSKLEISEERLDNAVRRAVGPAALKETVKSTAQIAAMARKNDAEIKYADRILDKDTIEQMPTAIDAKEMDDTVEMIHHPSIKVEIRATDLDSRKRGWGGIAYVDGVEEKRVPIEVYPTVSTDALEAGKFHMVDAIMEADRLPDGSLVPKRLHVVRVLDN